MVRILYATYRFVLVFLVFSVFWSVLGIMFIDPDEVFTLFGGRFSVPAMMLSGVAGALAALVFGIIEFRRILSVWNTQYQLKRSHEA